MSFLNSVLSAIGKDEAPVSSSVVRASTTPNPRTNGAGSTSSQLQPVTLNPGTKRKLDTEQSSNATKNQRTETSKAPARPNGNLVAPYVTSSSRPSNPQPAQLSEKPTPGAAKAATSSSSAPAAPPKKGSYKEIMARAQAAKAAQASIGQIKHKPVPKLSKKERLAQEAEMAQKAKAAAKSEKLKGAATTSSSVASKDAKKPTELGYKGTMRPPPQENAYKGTMRPPGSSTAGSRGSGRDAAKRFGPGSSSSRGKRYASYSDEDDEEEGGDDYASDESDDMEGGGFDELEREEEESLRAAKLEDEAARREEEKHHRLKAERKAKLMQLAAAARAKKK